VPEQKNAEDDTAVILYTSGTTGHPKGALLTNLGIIHSVLTFVRCFSLTYADRAVLAIPISHVSGLVGVFLCTACAGGCTVMMPTAYKTPAFLALAAREQMTYTILVPTIYTLCVNDPAIEAHDLSHWRLGCFGAPMPEATIKKLATRLPDLVLANSYGATETTSATALMPPGIGLDHLDSVGQIVPCGEVIIVGEDGRPQPPGAPGEIWIRGPMVVPGYWNRPDANKTGFTDGYWHSGDIGLIDAEGFLKIRDRLKDMVNRAGYKVFSAEVENVLSGHPEVLECAVVGRPDPVLGERVHAFVVARTPELPQAESLRAFCLQRMADYKVPETFDISIDPLPRNNNGKMQKAALRDRIRQPATLERMS
jgi:long-chain acyl-CoA synthetase